MTLFPEPPPTPSKAWLEAKGESSDVKEVEKFIRGYSYGDPHTAVVTDEKLCTFVLDELAKTQERFFNMIELVFELQKESYISKDLETLKRQVEAFVTQLKVRSCQWKGITAAFYLRLIKTDLQLIQGAQKLQASAALLEQKLLEHVKRPEYIQKYPKTWRNTLALVPVIHKQIRQLVVTFADREAICNIRPIDLDRTYEALQEEIRAKYE